MSESGRSGVHSGDAEAGKCFDLHFRMTPAMSLLCLKVGVVAFIQATLKRENASIFTPALRP
jgi:hypothetical protein